MSDEFFIGPDWAERDERLREKYPSGKLVVVNDSLHDKYRVGGVVREVWNGKVVVFFVEDGNELEFLPEQLEADD